MNFSPASLAELLLHHPLPPKAHEGGDMEAPAFAAALLPHLPGARLVTVSWEKTGKQSRNHLDICGVLWEEGCWIKGEWSTLESLEERAFGELSKTHPDEVKDGTLPLTLNIMTEDDTRAFVSLMTRNFVYRATWKAWAVSFHAAMEELSLQTALPKAEIPTSTLPRSRL
jgi:hypothetical protein